MGRYNPNIHHRRSIRLKGYDYSQPGLYFITICTQNREHLFGNIENGKMMLNDAGIMVETEWLKLPERFQNIQLHQYIVMPNHFHAILEITDAAAVGAILVVAPNTGGEPLGQPQGITPTGIAPTGIAPTGITPIKRKNLGDMVGAFGSITTVEYIRGVNNKNWQPFDKKLWQRNYWEHIIRNEKAFHRISDYIKNNPLNWKDDKLNG